MKTLGITPILLFLLSLFLIQCSPLENLRKDSFSSSTNSSSSSSETQQNQENPAEEKENPTPEPTPKPEPEPEPTPEPTPKVDSVEAFSKTLHPLVVQHCGQCHGNNRVPLFAQRDVKQSHDTLLNLNLVSLLDPEASFLVDKIKAGHRNFRAEIAEDLADAIDEWAKQL